MIRYLLCLLTWIVISAAAYGQVRSADVLYTHFDSVPTRGFRVGDEVFVPIDDLARWEWSITTRGDLAFIKMEGLEIMIPTRSVNGRVCVPVVAAVRKAGGIPTWENRGDTLRVTSELTSVRVQNGFIKLYSAFRVQLKAAKLDDPTRVAIDISGSEITSRTEQVLDPGVTLTQVGHNVVRLVVEAEKLPDLNLFNRAGRSFEMQLPFGSKTGTNPKVDKPILKPTAPPNYKPTVEPPPRTNVVPVPVVAITTATLPIKIERDDARGISINFPLVVNLSGPAQARATMPNRLEIVLPGINHDLPAGFKFKSPLVTGVERSYDGAGTVLTLAFDKPMASELWMDGKTVRLTIKRPTKPGSVSGLTIVVDPGHGGHDGGAKASNVFEKNLALSISKLVGEKLQAEGANVIMTRKTDVFVSLGNRAKIANDNDADLFISCHINSSAKPNGTSGTITFHHKSNPLGKLLAECIQEEIGKVNGLPDIGVWSDGRIYNSGFAVLRNTTKMPGVLLELGFINHATDRNRMVTQDFQDKVAAAVVKGIKVYLANGS